MIQRILLRSVVMNNVKAYRIKDKNLSEPHICWGTTRSKARWRSVKSAVNTGFYSSPLEALHAISSMVRTPEYDSSPSRKVGLCMIESFVRTEDGERCATELEQRLRRKQLEASGVYPGRISAVEPTERTEVQAATVDNAPQQEHSVRHGGEKTFGLSPALEALRQTLIAAAAPLRNRPWYVEGYVLGTLIQPAHSLEGGKLPIPERRYEVRYAPGYGVTSRGLGTSNGSAGLVAGSVRDDTRWEPKEVPVCTCGYEARMDRWATHFLPHHDPACDMRTEP
jgi:hypothetical protein